MVDPPVAKRDRNKADVAFDIHGRASTRRPVPNLGFGQAPPLRPEKNDVDIAHLRERFEMTLQALKGAEDGLRRCRKELGDQGDARAIESFGGQSASTGRHW